MTATVETDQPDFGSRSDEDTGQREAVDSYELPTSESIVDRAAARIEEFIENQAQNYHHNRALRQYRKERPRDFFNHVDSLANIPNSSDNEYAAEQQAFGKEMRYREPRKAERQARNQERRELSTARLQDIGYTALGLGTMAARNGIQTGHSAGVAARSGIDIGRNLASKVPEKVNGKLDNVASRNTERYDDFAMRFGERIDDKIKSVRARKNARHARWTLLKNGAKEKYRRAKQIPREKAVKFGSFMVRARNEGEATFKKWNA